MDRDDEDWHCGASRRLKCSCKCLQNQEHPIPRERAARAAPVSEEWGVTKDAAKKSWIRPELKRIGEIKDIAGSQTPNSQASQSAKS